MDCYPASVTLLGLEPDTIDLSVVRSSAVEAGLDGLVETIVREVQRLGYTMLPETGSEDRHYPIRDLTRHFGM